MNFSDRTRGWWFCSPVMSQCGAAFHLKLPHTISELCSTYLYTQKSHLIYRSQTSALLFFMQVHTCALLVTPIKKNQFQHNLTAVLLHLMASVWWQPAWRHIFVDESMERWMNSAVGIISLPLHTCCKVNAVLFALCKQCSCRTRQTVCRRASFLFYF